MDGIPGKEHITVFYMDNFPAKVQVTVNLVEKIA